MPSLDNMGDIATIIEIGVVLAGAVWVVAAIKSKTSDLGANINRLANSIDKLDRAVESLDKSVRDLDRRVTRIEAIQSIEDKTNAGP